MTKWRNGFTIVELLIVIVVIAILAAISIVAYNDIQQRAHNAQVIAGVNTYQKALLQYATINSVYPSVTACLGAGYPGNQCWQGQSGNVGVNGTLDSQLATVMGSKPVLATELFSIGIGDNMRAGAMWNPSQRRIFYYLQGPGQNCGLSGSSGTTEGGVVTQCSVALPAPS
jgi:prepilin-type N-terminal cleavage/methylation domain-containing protein